MIPNHVKRCDDPVRKAQSSRLYARGLDLMPQGVSRATIDIDPVPIYIERGEGAYLVDVDNNRLLDLNNNFTTLIHGHGFRPVVEVVAKLLRDGTCFSNPTEHELALAELLVSRIPAMEMVRFVNSGTEAVMFAIKAARAFTGRPAIVRFEGAYHGAYDWAEVGQAGSYKSNTSGQFVPIPVYNGAPASVGDDVIVLEFNEIEGMVARLEENKERIAGILIDPMPSRAGFFEPDQRFIETLTGFAKEQGILIIADEVLNIRQSYAGASDRYGFKPDLIATGKIIGGGFPIGAIGGRAEVMSVFQKRDGNVALPQGGTFSANPISMAAGIAAMGALTPSIFAHLENLGSSLRARLSLIAQSREAPYSVTGAASLFRIHPKRVTPTTYRDAIVSKDEALRMRELTRHFERNGVLLPFGAAASLSTPMTEKEVDLIASLFDDFLINNPVREDLP
ncbi:aminotransferase class-III family protein [Ochrobactrum quorumnocens]|uniref:Aminotransferase class-III family protein n=1 Tax=Ochrobactrum quorumnocens TaxID=271865 RepID=A0A248UCZ4_9HYPH|nr:aspartate aminotransferase family protein [[Ochrobactrum] quorumnocens]ASV84568.1 aminotransferase class-III family protein [[Ochrobactrum] quorumnocens]